MTIPKNIVIINCDGIGDVMLSTPAILGLRKLYPISKITFIVSPISFPLAKEFNFIDIVLTYEKGENIFQILRKIWHFDLGICLDGRSRSAKLLFFAMVKERIGAANALSIAKNGEGLFSLKRKLFLNKPIYLDGSEYDHYQAENLAKIIEKGLNIKLPVDYTKLCLPYIDLKYMSENKRVNFENSTKVWAVSPFSSGTWKDWQIDNYIELFKRLDKYNTQIRFIILGSRENKKIAIDFPDLLDLRGKTNLLESMAVLQQADYFIGGCSGLLHMATAANLPIIALYGPTSAKQYAPKHKTLVVQAATSDNFSKMMETINVDEVFIACVKLMQMYSKIT